MLRTGLPLERGMAAAWIELFFLSTRVTSLFSCRVASAIATSAATGQFAEVEVERGEKGEGGRRGGGSGDY